MRLRSAGLLVSLAAGLVLGGFEPPALAAPVDAWSSAYSGPADTSNNPGESVVTAANAGRIRQAWQVKGYANETVAPTVVGGVLYYVENGGSRPAFTARAVRTGRQLWTLPIPAGENYYRGVSVVGHLAVLPFEGYRMPGGVTVIDLSSHRIVWNLSQPDMPAGQSSPGGQLVADGGRVYQLGSAHALVAYRLTDGAVLWTAPFHTNSQGYYDGIYTVAAANGIVYTGGDEGLVAYDAASGRRLWSGPGGNVVAVAGGRVFSASLGGLYAYPASGCGRPSCTAAWADRIYAEFPFGIHLGGVDAHQLFVTYTESTGNGATSYIKRLSATTGATQWSATVDGPGGDPIRGGSTVWLREGCIDRVQGITATCILGFAASGTGHRPLLKLTLPSSRNSASGGLAISGGTLVDLDWYAYVTGYRVPGT